MPNLGLSVDRGGSMIFLRITLFVALAFTGSLIATIDQGLGIDPNGFHATSAATTSGSDRGAGLDPNG